MLLELVIMNVSTESEINSNFNWLDGFDEQHKLLSCKATRYFQVVVRIKKLCLKIKILCVSILERNCFLGLSPIYALTATYFLFVSSKVG